MPNPSDPGHNPFEPRPGSTIDPRRPWGTPTSAPDKGPAEIAHNPSGHAPASPRGGRESPDAGTPGLRFVTWCLVLVLFGLAIFMQQCAERPSAQAPVAQADALAPDDLSSVMTRLFIKLGRAAGSVDPASGPLMFKEIEAAAAAAPEQRTAQVRAAIAEAELVSTEAALQRLESTAAEIEIDTDPGALTLLDPADRERAQEAANAAREDIRLLRGIYAGHADALTTQEREHLVRRHGRLAEIALTFGRPESDPDRQRLVGGGQTLMVVFLGFGALLLLVIPASFACAVVAILRMTSPRSPRAFVAPAPGGSVYLETLAVFLFCFLLVRVAVALVATLAPATDEKTLTLIGLIAQWPVALAAFWPVLRGVPLAEHARRVGWTRGKGILREIGAGIFGYLAGLPLVMIAFAITVIAVIIRTAIQQQSGEPATGPQNPVIDLAMAGGILPLLLAALAVIWAPFTEESIFRGCLFRHLRSRTGAIFAAIISALFFGFMHGYEVIALLPVITLGFNFALMREWRGSLIGPIVAHALHNGTVMSLLLFTLSQIG